MLRSNRLAVVGFVLLVSSLCAARNPDGTFQKTLQVTGPVDLSVLTHSGDIVVHSGPAGTVSISGKIFVGERWWKNGHQAEVAALEKDPPIRQSGNLVRIEYPEVRNIAIDYEITAPADTVVRTESGSGDQEVEGLQGSVTLESGSGDIRLRDLKGEVRTHSGSGNVEARDVSSSFHAEAGSGDIRVEAAGHGDVSVHTGSGNIELRGVNGALSADAGSGDITIEGTQVTGWQVRTGSGNVEIRLPGQAAFNLEASTSSGDVTVGDPVEMVVQGNLERARHSIKGKVRGGGPLVSVHTGSGDVHID